ncbi:hypothetical protein GCM10027418_04390 [Mariniluteicoccus endophyticus]
MSIDATHVTVDQIADAGEDLLTPDEAVVVESHVAVCAECQETAAAVDATTALLAADPAPAMPDDVFTRLEAVVAAESERRESGRAAQEEAQASAAAIRRTALGTFGQNPAYGTKPVLRPRAHTACQE